VAPRPNPGPAVRPRGGEEAEAGGLDLLLDEGGDRGGEGVELGEADHRAMVMFDP
jgi:hypothetical protein